MRVLWDWDLCKCGCRGDEVVMEGKLVYEKSMETPMVTNLKKLRDSDSNLVDLSM
jgi:hypothetical protein